MRLIEWMKVLSELVPFFFWRLCIYMLLSPSAGTEARQRDCTGEQEMKGSVGQLHPGGARRRAARPLGLAAFR